MVEKSAKGKVVTVTSTTTPSTFDPALQFPVTNFYELEGRVHADNWSIPVKRGESLGRCLQVAIRMAQENVLEKDEHCKKFLSRTLPESFEKVCDPAHFPFSHHVAGN